VELVEEKGGVMEPDSNNPSPGGDNGGEKPPPDEIVVKPANPNATGRTQQFAAIGKYSDGSTQDLTATAKWSFSDSDIAVINAAGLATCMMPGATTITATVGEKKGTTKLTVPTTLITFTDLGDADAKAFASANNRVNNLLTASERRGRSLSDAEILQLKDALELLTEYLNNNPGMPLPTFNRRDLAHLNLTFNVAVPPGPTTKFGTGSGQANVIDDRFRAISELLYQPPGTDPRLEPQNGMFPEQSSLDRDQKLLAAVYGRVANTQAAAPQYRSNRDLITSDDRNRGSLFNQTVTAAYAHFLSNEALYTAVLLELVKQSRPPKIKATDWASVVDILVRQGISAQDSQLETQIRRALDTAQNFGQAPQPSQIQIDLPDLEQDVSNFEIVKENIFALQPAYFASMLEELKVFQVVEKLVEMFQNGILPVVKGDAGNLLFNYWKNAPTRVSESERRNFYARTLGFPGGDADSPNRDFKDLFMRFVSAVSSFVRQNTVDNLLRSSIPGPISQQQVRKAGRDLATNISAHGYGIAYPMATELQKEINDVIAILKNEEIRAAYGAKDMWQVVDQVAGLELGGAKNSVKYRTMASAGATVFAWLAKKSTELASGSYALILDVAQLQNGPTYPSKPTTDPSDFDLVGACDQWLAVTGTQEDSVDKMAQPNEAPAMPSRPIQIPSVAREMLQEVGVPMAYAAGNGQAGRGSWRYK
jgi:hypothetical protein